MKHDFVKIGLLGCGPIAQYAHLPALGRATNVKLTALCDIDEELLTKIGRTWGIDDQFTDHHEFLAQADMDAVLIAVSDSLHIPLATDALRAGKHVLVEKPLGTNSHECRQLLAVVEETNLKLQVGSMKRHDPGIDFARRFVQETVGQVLSVSGWYCDTLFRPTIQRALLPAPRQSRHAAKSANKLKKNLQHYSLATHGAHLFDILRYLGGEIIGATARIAHAFGQYSWHGLLEFMNGGLGHFELTIKQNNDWSEGYTIQGEGGGVEVRTFLPFYYRPSKVTAFDANKRQSYTPLGEDSNPYKRQVERFAESILYDLPTNPDVYEGMATVCLLESVEESVKKEMRIPVALDRN